MLLSNANDYYIDVKQIASMYYGGQQVYELTVAPTENFFSTHSWSDIKTICDAGNVGNYVKAGDVLNVSAGTFGDITFRVVGINQPMHPNKDTSHGLFLQVVPRIKQGVWSANTSASYGSSVVQDWCENTFFWQLPSDLRNVCSNAVVCTATSSSITTKCFILSTYNYYGGNYDSFYTSSSVSLKSFYSGIDTWLLYYKNIYNNYTKDMFPCEGFATWCREIDDNYSGKRAYISWNASKNQELIATLASDTAWVNYCPCICI